MSAELSSGDTSPLKGPAPKALPEDTSELDRADDAMPLTSPGDQPVQFVQGQPTNGDAKVEIGDAGTTPAFVGLGKEELMKYANDPFWIKLRWFLFILFWVLWVAMLVGAIVIIVLAPKCAEQKAHPEAYYELNVKNFAKDGKLSDLGERAKYLAELGVTSVINSDVLKKEDGGTVDFKEIDESYGTTTNFADAVKKLKSEGLRVLLSLVPNHSGTKHRWFNDTEKEDYYIRKSEDDVGESTWKTVDNPTLSAWATDSTNSSIRYLQQFSGNADFNFGNEQVVEEIKGVLSYWKSKGVDGFLLSAASYLVEDLDELKNPTATINQPENVEIVKRILNRGESDPHSLVEVKDLNSNDAESYIHNGIIPLSQSSDLLEKIDQYVDSSVKKKFFKDIQSQENAIIRLSGPKNRLGKADTETADLFRLLAFTSNASVIIYYGDEVDNFDSKNNTVNWDEASNNGSAFSYLKKLTKIQQNFLEEKDENNKFTYPATEPKDIFSFARSEKYAVIANFGSSSETVDFKTLLGGSKAGILIATPNANALKEGMPATDSVILPGKSGVLLEKLVE